jgi:hypothetical protein
VRLSELSWLMSNAREVIEKVKGAFLDTPMPPSHELINRHCCECVEVSEAFAGKTWQEITLDDLLAGRETALLTAAAWRYYLPSVVIWCVRAPETVDVIQDNLVYQLAPPLITDSDPLRQWFEERMLNFSAEQRNAIVAFLDWHRERDEANWASAGGKPTDHVYKALEYWRR